MFGTPGAQYENPLETSLMPSLDPTSWVDLIYICSLHMRIGQNLSQAPTTAGRVYVFQLMTVHHDTKSTD